MRAIVIRRRTDRKVLCFGPENGSYDPGVPDKDSDRIVEPDYNAVLAEWQAAQPPPVDKRAAVLADPQVPQWFKDWIR